MDYLGNIAVPAVTPSGVFPIQSEYPYGQAHAPEVIVHRFGSRDAKTEQRFLVGDGAARFTIKRAMPPATRAAFLNFWRNNQGALGQFTYHAPNVDGSTTDYICRFADPGLTLESAAAMTATVGITIVGVPANAPSYAVNATVTRYPDLGLSTSLLDQVQEVFPLITITPLDPVDAPLYISDRRAVVGGRTYLPRLVDWDGIQQQLGGGSDQARFTLGNADRVMTAVANSCDLFRARLEFSLFHVNSGTKIDLWAGSVTNWSFNAGASFSIEAADGAYELALPYPTRRISRVCDKVFKSSASGCPWGGQGDGASCDKSFRGPNGCQAHGMSGYFRGVEAQPQGVDILDNSTGAWGFGRNPVQSTSIVADTVYDQVVPEIWCDYRTDPNCSKGLVVNAKIISGRDESDFYAALGIVGEGPISAYAQPGYYTRAPQPGDLPTPGYYPRSAGEVVSGNAKTLPNGVTVTMPFTLDGQANHGWPLNGYGLRASRGPDPSAENFSLGEGGAGIQTYSDIQAAGLAFCEIRRVDQKGIQPSNPTSHAMKVTVRGGMAGWTWTAPGARVWTEAISNPVWVLVNMWLRARGLYKADLAEQEASFIVADAIDAAAVCDLQVTPVFGSSTPEKQFKFAGVFQEEKPLRDWMQEVANTFAGYFSFSFGKLKIGARCNSSVDAAGTFSAGNIVFGSLSISAARPAFNHLTANFGDEEFSFQANSVSLYDQDHAVLTARTNSNLPQFLKQSQNLVGVSTKSQAARLITMRLREELGGVNRAQWKAARNLAFKTTILGLGTETGKVCSLTHEDMPDYPATNVGPGDPNYQAAQPAYGEFRVAGWKLNKDYSIDVQGRTTHNDMYNLVAGPKPSDVMADPMPVVNQNPPGDFDFQVAAVDGKVQLSAFECKANSDNATQAYFETFYIDEPSAAFGYLSGGLDASAETGLAIFGPPPTPGAYLLVDDEILEVTDVQPSSPDGWWTVSVTRGALGTTAAIHPRIEAEILGVNGEWNCELHMAAGLNFQPGTLLISNQGAAMIASYDQANGVLRTTLPLGTPAAGIAVYADPRVWILTKRSDPLVLPYRFFSSPARAGFIHSLHQANAAVALVRARVENPVGNSSAWTVKHFPPPMRTGGGAQLVLPFADLAAGETNSAFNEIKADEAQMFEDAYAEIVKGYEGPLSAPPAPTAATPSGQASNATITLSGTATDTTQISISIDGPLAMQIPTWNAWEDDARSATEVAEAIQNWLNGNEAFAQAFVATAYGATIQITDTRGVGGTVSAAATDGMTAAAEGFTSTLGIRLGRIYWFAYTTDEGYRSPLSASSPSTGPTGAATTIVISGFPMPADPRVTHIEIYAADLNYFASRPGERMMSLRRGLLRSTPRLIGTVAPGAETFTDTNTAGILTGLGQYPGPNQPGGNGTVLIVVTRDGAPWFQLFVPAGQAHSNVVPGAALGPISLDTAVNADLINTTGAVVDLRVVLE